MSKKEIFKYLIESNSSISVYQVVFAMLAALVLGLFMYFMYRKTYSGVAYSKSFNQTLVLLAVIVTMVMTIIGGSLALSLGMVGSLSVIRFRTAIKEPKDMAFLFWAIAIGLSCGAEMYVVAVVGSAVIAILLLFFRKDAYDGNTYLIAVRGNALDSGAIEKLIGENTRSWKLRMRSSTGEYDEITYEAGLKKSNASELARALREIDGTDAVNVVTYTGEVIG
ncbi:MAG: DUF4956 domain-containing protein [Lachnospiraceae bacterium]|nr:DUF4956 domain-containing protein [Lachnospiraceae bacterium]